MTGHANRTCSPRLTGSMLYARTWAAALGRPGQSTAVAVCLLAPLAALAQEREPSRTSAIEAIILWLGLIILAVLFLGIGLMWGVSRGAKRILRRRDRPPTMMPDIWFLNPPEKRRRDDDDTAPDGT